MLKFATYHKKVWFASAESIEPAEPYDAKGNMRKYKVPFNTVAVVYSNTEDKFLLYAGHEADKKSAMELIVSLAMSLEVTTMEIKDLEKIQDLRDWDKYVENVKKLLAINEK